MRWLLIGYMYLFIHRPFEIWPFLGTFRIELLYALTIGAAWVISPSRRWLPNRLHLAFFSLAGAILFCWGVSPWSSTAFDHIYNYFALVYFYILLTSSIHEEEDLRLIVQAFFAIMALYALHSLYEFRCGRFVYRMAIPRLVGVDISHNDPNSFSASLLYALTLLPAAWVAGRSQAWRTFLVCHVALTVGCVALTGSRAGLVTLIFWVGITIWRSRFRWAFALAVVLSAPFLWSLLPPSLQNRFETIINPDAGPLNAKVSGQQRLLGLWLGVELFDKYPITGCGPGSWKKATGSSIESHNLYAQVIGELGLLGAIPFACVVLLFWRNTRRIARLYREHPHWERDFLYTLSWCLATALLLLLLNGNFGHNLFRYTWLWYGAFLIIARHCVEQRALAEAGLNPHPAPWQAVPPRARWAVVPS